MEQQSINLKEQTEEKLESIAYKLIVQIQQLNAALQQVQVELQERQNGKKEVQEEKGL